MSNALLARLAKLEREQWRREASRGDAGQLRRRAAYRGDPGRYAVEVLGRTPTPQQLAIWRAAETPPYQVLVPSANTQGKTFAGACYASYFFDTYDPSTTLITAPTQVQVRDLMFKELRSLRPSTGFLPRDTRLETSWEHFVHGLTAATADAFQGRHAEKLLIIFDEATGVHKDFWDRARTMFGRHAGHAWIAFYNPNDPSSPAYEAEESGLWHVVRLNALEHVNVLAQLAGDPPPIPAAVRLETVLARLLTECEPVAPGDVDRVTDFQFPPPRETPWPGAPALMPGQWWRPASPAFEAQVLGRWPLIATMSLFSPALVDKCAATVHPDDPALIWQVGCDVARFGDDRTAIAVRRGPCLVHLETLAKRDTSEIARRIDQIAYRLAGDDRRKRVAVVVDGTGGYGGGVVDQLPDYRVVDLSMSAESPDPRVLRMRSYLWFRLAEIAVAGLLDLSRLDHKQLAELKADLVIPRYRVDDRNRKVLEPKHQIKQRLGRSPDAADAVALAYYTG